MLIWIILRSGKQLLQYDMNATQLKMLFSCTLGSVESRVYGVYCPILRTKSQDIYNDIPINLLFNLILEVPCIQTTVIYYNIYLKSDVQQSLYKAYCMLCFQAVWENIFGKLNNGHLSGICELFRVLIVLMYLISLITCYLIVTYFVLTSCVLHTGMAVIFQFLSSCRKTEAKNPPAE